MRSCMKPIYRQIGRVTYGMNLIKLFVDSQAFSYNMFVLQCPTILTNSAKTVQLSGCCLLKMSMNQYYENNMIDVIKIQDTVSQQYQSFRRYEIKLKDATDVQMLCQFNFRKYRRHSSFFCLDNLIICSMLILRKTIAIRMRQQHFENF